MVTKSYNIPAVSKPRTKAQLFATLSETTELTRGQVADVFEAISAVIEKDLGSGGPGVVNLGGLMKVQVQHKPATPERAGTNPFTGEATTFKAKPARNVIKVRPLKTLKELV